MLFALMSSLRRAAVDWFIDVAGRGKKSEWRRTRQKVLNCSKFVARGQTRVVHVVKTCNTRETHVIIRVPAVIKTWGDAVRRESLGNSHGQSTVIGRMLRVGITGNSVCLAACHWRIYFSVLRQCLGSASAVEQPPTAIPRHKARPSQNWPKITTYDHVHKIFINSCTWFRRGVLCDRGLNAMQCRIPEWPDSTKTLLVEMETYCTATAGCKLDWNKET